METTLAQWKAEKKHTPLIIKGCRQCGKSFIVEKFGRENYEHVILLDFVKDSSYSAIFEGSLDVDHLTMLMSANIGTRASFVPGKTLIVFDEIQECPNARTALKYFALDGRYDVIGTGSLLGVHGYGKKNLPASGSSWPQRIFSRVVLPHPLGPSRNTRSKCAARTASRALVTICRCRWHAGSCGGIC